MHLSGVEGLTPEQIEAITAQHTLSTEGLANKNAELLNEKKTVQQRLNDESQALEDSRLAAVKANEEALKELRKMSDVDFAKFYQTLPPRVQLLLRGRMVRWEDVLPEYYIKSLSS